MRQNAGRVAATIADMNARLMQADETLVAMSREQRVYEVAKKAERVEAYRKALRLFSEAHFAFLGATYSVGDYLLGSTVRAYSRHEVKPFLESPIGLFHRKIRNCAVHSRGLQYGEILNFNVLDSFRPADTFPSASLVVAAAYGAVVHERQATLGAIVLSYRAEDLDASMVPYLAPLKKALGCSDVSVIFAAERYLEGLRTLVVRAELENRMRTTSCS